ncbi:Cys-Gln thioester bond-forming surface protein [uncultured Clostridium sp.]|uniref:thioester domain-containing protein n=1 Tax=uncultured Clostridium sp. TaxID=59620 RepID=UPI0025E7984B|nr:Cys-Gln thioester bond-forming surface protein [uncultured Clostridium sp.]
MKIISFFIILSTILNSMVSAYGADKITIPDEIIVKSTKDRINTVQCGDYNLSASKIKAEGRDEVVYCLEIDQSYPSGEVFRRDDKLNKEVDGIITNGYPNVSFEELNLSNENDAYFATQIAIWICLEGYDVSKIKSNNMAVLNAIKTIYSRGMAQNK